MMEQYFQIKEQYKDFLLFYRLGDFYEMFFDDAVLASRELELTLTGRDCGEAERAPMCGVPFHSSEVYIGRLIEKGYKVAICEQTEDPAQAKGLVRREVVRVVTPGTLIETNLLSEQKNNYLCALYMGEFEFGVCFADISTAQVYATTFDGNNMESRLRNELGTYLPREILCNLKAANMGEIGAYITSHKEMMLNDGQGRLFDFDVCRAAVRDQFGDRIRGEILENKALCMAVGAVLAYLSETEKSDLSYMKELTLYSDGQFLEMDLNSRRNLELTESMRTKEKKGSLLWVLDKTRTAPGARMLRKWVEHPLLSTSAIAERQGAVEELCGDFMLREELSEMLSHVLDLERLITRIVYGSANGKDLRAVSNTAEILPEIRERISTCKSACLRRICEELDPLLDVHEEVTNAIREDAPFSVREGGIIADGFDPDVDYLRSVMADGKGWIEKLAEEEREKTGIKTLKVSYNRVFGYYIEVTKSLIAQVPDRYIRKQTLSNCERYITQELKDLEGTILGAADKICALEYELFQKVRNFVSEQSARIQRTAALLAELDAYLSLATVASKNKYVRPEVDESDVIEIRDGRHPVVEQFVKDTYFVPNDVLLDTNQNRLMLITGPNMAGKSTYMRQVALITVMAQIGSFVPASEARIGVVDKVFTRVGASDDLASGQSTFMLEMNEVSYILKNATRKSLIIYDEVGRGTSTFDGMSIARAIVEYTNSRKIGAKTLFATHYHELTVMENEFEGVVNYNIAAKKRGDSITFLRKIVRGSTDDSYGIEVAKLAGLPNEVIKRAREILASVEETSKAISDSVEGGIGKKKKAEEKDDSLISFDDCINEQVIAELKAVDLNTLSPFECMSFLFDLKKRLQ
ncbi:MAG: DNA mismatch repair protein MutS [Ruminococcaceae bacterium]|nr:DNA mismatch repair protein MutS [Oscillospiraceae bacterium]